MPYADHVISLDSDGTVSEQGTFDKLEIMSGYVSTFNLPKPDWDFVEEKPSTMTTYTYVPPNPNQIQDNLEAEANRSTGDMTIYLYYVRAIGWGPTSIFIIAMTAFIFCISFPREYHHDRVSVVPLLTLSQRSGSNGGQLPTNWRRMVVSASGWASTLLWASELCSV